MGMDAGGYGGIVGTGEERTEGRRKTGRVLLAGCGWLPVVLDVRGMWMVAGYGSKKRCCYKLRMML